MESFALVARSGSFSAAARALGISRAIVSRQIVQLEDHLGVRLVNRTTRSTALTADGQRYFELCATVLDSIRETEAALKESRREAGGTLKISAPAAFGVAALAPAAVAFTRLYPDISVSVMTSEPVPQAADWFENGFDIVIRFSTIEATSLIQKRIGSAPWLLCASPDYLGRHDGVDEPGDLATHNCMIHEHHAPDGVWRFQASEPIDIPVSGALRSNNATILKSACLAGHGVAVLPAYACRDEIAKGRLVNMLEGYPVLPERPIYLFYAAKRFLPKRIQLFTDFIAGWLGQGSGRA